MDFFLQNNEAKRLPPEQVRILRFGAEPWLDGRRVSIHLEVTPFQLRPNAEVVILNASGDEVAQTTIIETMAWQLEFTMHLPQTEDGEEYLAKATLYYSSPIPEPPPATENEPPPLQLPESTVIDRAKVKFTVQHQPTD